MRIALLLLLAALPASARCMSGGWTLWPDVNSVVPTNPQFVFHAFGTSAADVQKFETFGPALLHGKRIIPLRVKQVNVGDFDVAQVVLSPAEELVSGAQYRLVWKGKPPAHFGEKLSWKTSKTGDDTAPTWKSAPVAIEGEHAEFGCGPADNARASIALEADGPLMLRARVTRGEKKSEYLLFWTVGDVINIGHGMCGGAFKFDDEPWSLELSAVDAAGNETPAPGAALRFKKLEPVK